MQMKVLVIIPAGPNTVHESWYSKVEDGVIIDFAIIWYSDELIFDTIKDSKYLFFKKGPKWALIRSVLQKIDWKEYDYIWLPDDDLKALNGTIPILCKTMEKYDLSLAQPSLIDQHVQWKILLTQPGEYHLTNFVEIQAPCFSKKGFEIIVHTIMNDDVYTGWGLDYVWSNIFEQNRLRIGVVDTVVMEHVRYVSKKVTKDYQGGGINPFEEMKLTLSRYNVKKFTSALV